MATGTTVLGISKTTLNGWLAAIIGACGPLAVYLTTQNNPKAAAAAGIVTLVATICRVWVGIIQGDTPPPGPNLSSKVPLILLALLLIPFAGGCKGPTVQQPLAPGYANSADQAMGQTLYAARGFYMRLYSNPSLSAAEKVALNDLGTALNVAGGVYVSYHNGTATEAQAQAAIDAVTAKQTAVQSLIPGVK